MRHSAFGRNSSPGREVPSSARQPIDRQPTYQKKEWPLGTATQAKELGGWVPTFSWQPVLVSSPFRVRAPRSAVTRDLGSGFASYSSVPRSGCGVPVSRRPCQCRRQHLIATCTEAGRDQHCRESRVPRQPVVGVELVERVNGLLLPLVRCVRHRGFEHADERERYIREEDAAEGGRAVPGDAFNAAIRCGVAS